MLTSLQHQKWLLKRKYTTVGFLFQSLVLGMEYSLTFLTLWLYIKEMVKTNNPKLYYAIISISYLVSSTAISPIIGKFVDRTRRVRLTFIFCNILLLVGNVVYSFYYSPWLLVGGRFLSGCGAGLKSVICGEIIRSYPSSETKVKLSLVSMMFTCGFIFGPGVNFFFKNVNFFIGKWHLKNVNFVSIFVSILCIIMEILSLTIIHDLSKEYNLKGEQETEKLINENLKDVTVDKENERTPLIIGVQQNSGISTYTSISVLETFKVLFTTYNSGLLLATSFFITFLLVTFDMWLPLLVVESLHLSILELNICVFGSGFFCAAMLLLYIWKPFSDYNMFSLVLIALFGTSVVNVSFIILMYFHNKILIIVLSIIFMISFACAGIVPDVFITNHLSKMINSRHQTFVDSIRTSMNAFASLLALATATYIFQYLEIFASVYVVITCILGCMFMTRRKVLMTPKVII